MIVKTNQINKKGQDIYQNVLTGETGVIGRIYVAPSQRRQNRHPLADIIKVSSNRATTRGRKIYYQTVGKKTIKHIQPTFTAISAKKLMMSFFDKIKQIIKNNKK